MITFMKQIDLFGKNINFKYMNVDKYKNKFGGILTIFTFFISLTIYIYFFKNYIERKESRIIYQPQKYYIPPPVNLTERNFFIEFKLQLFNGENLELPISIDDVFNINAQNWNNYTSTKLNVKSCSQPSTNCRTIEFDNRDILTGDETGIEIRFSFKDKKDFKNEFKDSNIYITTNMSDISFSLDNYTDPFQLLERYYRKKIIWDSINRNVIYTADLNYEIVNVTTDYAWFFETNIQMVSDLNLYNIAEKRDISETDDFYVVLINLTNEGHSFKKSFQKLSEFLASASSVSSIVFLIFQILSESYKNISLEAETLNSIFQYDSINKKEPILINLELNNVKEHKDFGIHLNEIGSNSKRYFRNINNLEHQKTLRNNVVKVLKFNNPKIVLMALCSCYRKKNNKIYSEFEAGSSILNYYLNYDNYILKMIELDYLKYLTLNKDQLNLFKFVKLDYLSKTYNNEFMHIVNNLEDNSLVCNSIKEMNEHLKDNKSLLKILKKSDNSEIDKKILNSVGFVDFNQRRIYSFT